LVQAPKNLKSFESLLEIITALRGPEGCPWDKEQTHRTLAPYVIEEAHELAEAIETGNEKELVSELGDLLLQVVLHSEIGRQEKRFEMTDVIYAICEKMVRRHPHVFGAETATTSTEVLANWAEIKAKEKKPSTEEQMRFDVALSMPSLQRSQKIGDKTNRLRFDWQNATEVLAKVDEELLEVKEEMRAMDKGALEHEIGDLLFSVAQLARHLGLEAEQCLRTANARFENRFFTMRKRIKGSGRDYDQLSPVELEEEWQRTKAALKSKE